MIALELIAIALLFWVLLRQYAIAYETEERLRRIEGVIGLKNLDALEEKPRTAAKLSYSQQVAAELRKRGEA